MKGNHISLCKIYLARQIVRILQMLSCLNLHLPVRFGFLLSAAQFWKVLQPILDELLKLLNELPFFCSEDATECAV